MVWPRSTFPLFGTRLVAQIGGAGEALLITPEAWSKVVDHQGNKHALLGITVNHLRLLECFPLERCLRPDPGGRELIFQSKGLRVEDCEVYCGAGHTGVLGPDEAGRCEGDHDAPDTDGPDFERGGLGNGALDGVRQLFGLALPVVALHHVLGVLAYGLDEPAAVVLETVADLPDQALVVFGLAAAVDVHDDHAPQVEVPVDQPIYELVYPLVHELLNVCDDFPLEALALG